MRPIPDRPEIIIRADCKEGGLHVLLQRFNSRHAHLVAIAEDCGGLVDFYCEIEISPGKLMRAGSDWFEFVDKARVPATHTKHPVATHAWLCCYYRDQAWQRGEFAPPTEDE